MADPTPIRDALERAARELELVATSLTQAGWTAAGGRAWNEAHAARAALTLHPDGTPQVSIGPAVDITAAGKLAVQPPTPIRDAAERLLQQLQLRRTDPGAPLALLRAEIKLRAALAAQPPASTKKCRLPNDLLLEWLQQRQPWATWMRPGGCLESAHLDLIALLQDAIAAADVGVPQPEQPPQGGEVQS